MAATLLTACGGGAPPAPTAAQGTTSVPAVTAAPAVPAVPVTTTTAAAGYRVGEPFTLGDLRLTVLSVEDPFPAAAATQPAPGNRLVSIRYEVVSLGALPLLVTELPTLEVGDAGGGTYTSEHGRVNAEVGASRRIERSRLFEVPGSAGGLRATFRAHGRPDLRAVVRLG